MIRRRRLWFTAVLLSLAAPLHGDTQIRTTSTPSPLPTATPAGVVRCVYRAIEVTAVGALFWYLSDEFRFVSDDPSFLESWPNGMDRAAELNFVKRLSESVRGIQITHNEISVDPPVTPMRAPSGTYQVRVKGAALRFTDMSHGEVRAQSREHIFEVVCVPIRATEGRSSRCVVRRWTEYSTAAASVAVAEADTADTSLLIADAKGDETAVLDLQVLSNGQRGGASFSISLPGPTPARLEMFDVAGRRVDSRDLTGLTRGTHAVGIPAQLANGVYWARLHQGTSMKTARVVVLR